MTRLINTVALLIVLGTVACGQAKNVTIVGEVVDVVSYLTTGLKADSPDGKEVLEASVAKGNPLGILESKTGKVYLVTMKQAQTGANETLKQWIGMKVAAKGDVYRKGSTQLLVLSVIGKSIN